MEFTTKLCLALALCVSTGCLGQARPNCLAPSTNRLIQTIRDGDLDGARALIRAGADLNVMDECGATPLWEAIRWNQTDFVFDLLASGADLKYIDDGANALIGAVFSCNLKLTSAFLKRGVAVDARNSNGLTALMEAADKRCKAGDVTALLLKAGADPNAHDKDGFNPLLAAAMGGDSASAAEPLEAGADPTFKSRSGRTAESESCDRGKPGHYEVCTLVRRALTAGQLK